jgi:hypothetical protein
MMRHCHAIAQLTLVSDPISFNAMVRFEFAVHRT